VVRVAGTILPSVAAAPSGSSFRLPGTIRFAVGSPLRLTLALAGAGRLALRCALGLARALRLALSLPTVVALLIVVAGTRLPTGRCRNGVTELAALVVVPAPDDVEDRGSG
jgi:hypothetical protein